MIENENIIIFSSDDWNSGLKTSKYHIAILFAQKNKVLFVNSIGLRSPNVGSGNDLKRIWDKLIKFFKGCEKVNQKLYVFTPIVIPFQKYSWVRSFNQWFLKVCVRMNMRMLKISKPIVFMFSQNMTGLIGQLGEKEVVYYCIDELSGYKDVDRDSLIKLEEELLKKADCVIACSKELADKKKKYNPATYYVPHGVDWALFRKAFESGTIVPDDIKSLSRPVIGYYGFISEDWIDFELLNFLAKSHPQWAIVLIGRSKSDLSQHLDAENIHFLGLKPFESLPGYSKCFDVGIIPFRINELTKSSNPLKMFEYLSSGLPVVSVNIPEVHRFKQWIEIADSKEAFAAGIAKALKNNNPQLQQSRSEAMRSESWDKRIEDISQIVKTHLN